MVWYWGNGARQFDDQPDPFPYTIPPDTGGGGEPPPGGTPPPGEPPPGGDNLVNFRSTLDNNNNNYTDPTYPGPHRPTFNFANAPILRAPRFAYNEKFHAPTAEDVANEPGFKFRLGQSTGAVERSAAARGVTRSGGTIQDILSRAGDFASQEYNNSFGRALQTYDTNYGVARDAYDRDYAATLAEFTPKFQEWSFRSGAEKDAAMAEFNQRFQEWLKQQDLALGYAGLGAATA